MSQLSTAEYPTRSSFALARNKRPNHLNYSPESLVVAISVAGALFLELPPQFVALLLELLVLLLDMRELGLQQPPRVSVGLFSRAFLALDKALLRHI